MKQPNQKLRRLFGRGSYSASEAAHLLKLPTARVRRWAAGYDFGPRGAPRFSEPLIHRELEGHGFVELSFLDLIELLFVKTFHAQGVSLQGIRRMAKSAAEMFQTDHPFCIQRFRTDGHTIYAQIQQEEVAANGRHTVDLASGHYVFETIIEPFYKQFTYDVQTKLVRQWRPLGPERSVLLDPALSFGQPVVAKFGVPTRAIQQAAKSGDSPLSIADWYGLPVDAVTDAIEYEHQLANAA
jgi:uncharacterized protein (DUF433 family)